jgi:CheY-like chemotaxis protein
MKSLTGSANTAIRVLYVEDDEEDYILARDMLADIAHTRYELEWVASYDAALALIQRQQHDVYLIDYRLGERDGLELLRDAIQNGCRAPTIILTGQGDEETDVAALKAGAADYLVKGQINTPLLERSIRYALERHRLQQELEQARQREQQEREMRGLQGLLSGSSGAVTPVRKSAPDTFKKVVGQYETLMDQALEQQAYKVEYNISEDLHTLADELGSLKAGPRDVVEIHTTALRRKTKEAASAKAQAYAQEGRLMLLELMGDLVSFYRSYSSGANRTPTPATLRTEQENEESGGGK